MFTNKQFKMSAPTTSPVLLGLCDEKIKDSSQTTWATTKIGGLPVRKTSDVYLKQFKCGKYNDNYCQFNANDAVLMLHDMCIRYIL